MDVKKIFVGAVIWSLGLFVPALHHGLLSIAAAHSTPVGTYNYYSLTINFFDLPWIDVVFFVVMWLVGMVLLISGFRPQPSER
jgi:hypothetical protein